MKTLYKTICLILLFAGSNPGRSQTSLTSPGKYFLFKNYTTQNGLLDNAIYLLNQDRHGYLWISSESGLTRFDGKTFYYKAIPEVYENRAPGGFFENTAEGNMIATAGKQGLFVQQSDGRFKKYSIRQNTWSSLKSCPDGRILAASTDVLYLVTTDSLHQLYDSGIRGLFKIIEIDTENRIWFGSERFGLGILKLSGMGYEPVFLPEFKDAMINYILFDDEGTLHVATYQGYYRIKWKSSQWDNYTIEQPFPQLKDIKINYVYLDNERNLWIPTSSYGVFRTKGDSITLHLTKENGLISSSVFNVIQDREGNYWFGTFDGISMIENFDNYAIAQNGVRFTDACGMQLDEYSRIWFFCSSPLSIFQDEKLIPINLSGTPIEKEGAWFVNFFNSELIIANNAGLYAMPLTKALPDLRKLRKMADFKANNVTDIFRMVTDSAGIWIYTMKNIYNYRDGRLLPVTFKHSDSILEKPCMLIPDNYGNYWYGDNRTGLYRGILSRPDNHTLSFESTKYYRANKADADFETEFIDYMYFDKEGNLWLSATSTGVYRFEIDSSGVVSYKLYTTANGLLSDVVKGIDCDDKGRVWFSTRKGIHILQYDSTGIETIHKLNMIKEIDLWYSGIPVKMGDRLFFLTQEGVFVTQNQLFVEKPKTTPKALITNILINGVVDSENSASAKKLRLAHGQNNITIEFAAITYRNADDVRYQYKLEGAYNEWSVLSDRGFVEYAGLRPGRYIFKVRARIGDPESSSGGEVGEYKRSFDYAQDDREGAETTISIRIVPAFYQTVWFYLLIVIIVSALLYSLYQYRIRHIIKMERLRLRIAADLHDYVGSTLSSISLISEMASRQDNASELLKALSKIGADSRDVLNSMDDVIWSVNPQNDSLVSLVVRLREFAIPVCDSKNITLNMNVEEAINAVKLDMEERRNIYLITKEAINNAVKHSGCTQLTVEFSFLHKQLEITVTDNGCGFDPAIRGLRNGITNMERRAKQTGSEFRIQSDKNSGTHIQLKTKNHIFM
jgi:signal transduction histidine kinase/ligand-binding sensor domain-containing protein